MKLISTLLIVLVLLSSCNNAQKSDQPTKAVATQQPSEEENKNSFFPVTDYLKGQIAELKRGGVNPLKKTVLNNKLQDSVWLKHEDMDKELADFLVPPIDSSNMTGFFSEKKFLDQTVGAFTFTYDPIRPLPDSFLLQRWDVYIDPELNTVKRIYIIKKTTDHKILQLTWQANKSCRIITIATDPAGKDYVEKEVTLNWDF